MRAVLKHLSTVRVSTFYLMVAYAVVGFVCGFLFKIERIDVGEHVSDRGVSLPIGILRFPSFYQGFIRVHTEPFGSVWKRCVSNVFNDFHDLPVFNCKLSRQGIAGPLI